MTATNEPRLTREKILDIQLDIGSPYREATEEEEFLYALCKLALIGLATETSGVIQTMEQVSQQLDAIQFGMIFYPRDNLDIALAKFKEATGVV